MGFVSVNTLRHIHRDDSLTIILTDNGEIVQCSKVVICTGTFLSGEIHIGLFHFIKVGFCEGSTLNILQG